MAKSNQTEPTITIGQILGKVDFEMETTHTGADGKKSIIKATVDFSDAPNIFMTNLVIGTFKVKLAQNNTRDWTAAEFHKMLNGKTIKYDYVVPAPPTKAIINQIKAMFKHGMLPNQVIAALTAGGQFDENQAQKLIDLASKSK